MGSAKGPALANYYKAADCVVVPSRNEPFGITTIQGLAQGCLPMVHNSGGQKEIIPHADQRFDDADEAAKRLEEWAERGKDVCRKRVDALQKDIKQYTAVHFRKKFADLLNEYL